MNKGLFGPPLGELLYPDRDYAGSAEDASDRAFTTLNTWEEISGTQITVEFERGAVYLVRFDCVLITLSNNFDHNLLQLALDDSLIGGIYADPTFFQTQRRDSSVGAQPTFYRPHSALFVLTGVPEGSRVLSMYTHDNNSDQDRTYTETHMSIEQLTTSKYINTAPGSHGVARPMNSFLRTTGLRRPFAPQNIVVGTTTDTSTRSFTGSGFEAISGTVIEFEYERDMEYVAHFYHCYRSLRTGFNVHYVRAEIDGSTDGITPVQHEFASQLANVGQANVVMPGSAHFHIHPDNFPTGKAGATGRRVLRMATSEGGSGDDRDIYSTTVVLLRRRRL